MSGQWAGYSLEWPEASMDQAANKKQKEYQLVEWLNATASQKSTNNLFHKQKSPHNSELPNKKRERMIPCSLWGPPAYNCSKQI